MVAFPGIFKGALEGRARQITDGAEPMVNHNVDKALSIAVEELNQGKIKIVTEEE